jgi:HEAT repeat protein
MLIVLISSAIPRTVDADDEVQRLSKQAWGAEYSKRISAVKKLTKLGPQAREAIPVLTKILDRKGDDQVGELSARAVIAIGSDSVSVPLLREILSKRNEKYYIADALGELGPAAAPAVPELKQLLGNKGYPVRRAGALALGKIGPGALDALPQLVQALDDPQDYHHYPGQIAQAIASIGPQAVPYLITVLETENFTIREGVAKTLGEIGADAETAIPALIEKLSDKYKRPNIYASALGKIGPNAIPALLSIIENANEEAIRRMYAVYAIGEMGSKAKDTVPELIKRLEDLTLQIHTIEALGKIGPDAHEAVPHLIEFKDGAEHPYLKKISAQALVKIATPRALQSTRFFRSKVMLLDFIYSSLAILIYIPGLVLIVPVILLPVSLWKGRRSKRRLFRWLLWAPVIIWTIYGIYETCLQLFWMPNVVAPIRIDLLVLGPVLFVLLVVWIIALIMLSFKRT